MDINKQLFIFYIIILFIFINFSSCHYLENLINNLNNDYYLFNSDIDIKEIKLDEFVSGNINNNKNDSYKIKLLYDDFEEIFFDFQSEYGCLHINIINNKENNPSSYFEFCSNGNDNIFSLNKSDIIDNINIENLDIIITIATKLDINFIYSLKISLRKQHINIFEIKSEHKYLCKTEKLKDDKYGCLFMFTNNINESNWDNLIIYSKTQNDINEYVHIYADFINKTDFDDWKIEELVNKTPNNESEFNNYNNETNFINIPNLKIDKYIYISIESYINKTVEILVQKITDNNEEIKFPKENDILIYSINNNFSNINLNFSNLLDKEIALSLVTLYGKASIFLGNDDSSEYITDVIENKLFFIIDAESYKKNKIFTINVHNLEGKDEKKLGFIFYISFSSKTNNVLKEISFGKSSKIIYNNFSNPIILYQQIPKNNNFSYNINLQLYNFQVQYNSTINIDNFDIKIVIASKEDIYQFKENYSYINKYNNIIEAKLNNILSYSSTYLSKKDIDGFYINDKKYILIFIVNNTIIKSDKLILGCSILPVDSLIYPSERIYHFGNLNNNYKVVHRLKGNKKYHLMRLEFSSNDNDILWSVKRTPELYSHNDSDLSFVTEKWINGRELLTMYIENGEDIYLTVFTNNTNENPFLKNYIFKYINSAKNGDFRNYIIKNDYLYYDEDEKLMEIGQLKSKLPLNIQYFLILINEEDYIRTEEINTIAFIESKKNVTITGNMNKNKIVFNLKNYINREKDYYLNAYSVINENNSNIEYLAYSGFKIKGINITTPKKELIIASVSIGGFIFLTIIFRSIRYYYKNYIY